MNIYNITKKYKKIIFLIIILSFVQVLTDLFLPKLMSSVVDTGIINKDVPFIIDKGILMLAFAVLGIISSIVVIYLSTKFASSISYDLRKKLYEKITIFTKTDIDKFGSASLITRTTNDVNHISDTFSMALRLVLMAPIMGIGAIIMAYITNPGYSYIIVISILVLVFSIILIFFIVYKKFERLQKLVDKINAKTKEILYGLKTIRSYNREKYFIDNFNKTNKENVDLIMFLNKIMLLANPLILILVNYATIFIVFVASKDINTLEVGNVMAYIQYLSMVLMSFTIILLIIILIPRTLVSLKRVEEVLKTKPSIVDSGTLNLNQINSIEFKNVYFKYKDTKDYILKDISFKINNGEDYTFIGGSGSGKTTIINLMLRHIKPTKGQILINGKDISLYKISSIREKMSYVPQNPLLFKGSIKENIVFDEVIKDEEIIEVSSDAMIKDFIEEKTLNYNIEQAGSNLSGGQKGRITLLRALIKKCDLLILDDALSAVDYITDKNIRESLNKKYKNIIKIYVTQRIGTIKNIKNIIVLNEGKVESIGSYDELLKTSKTFKDFSDLQERNDLR